MQPSARREAISLMPFVSGKRLSLEFEAQFQAIFEQHWGRLHRLLFLMLGDWDAAEDLALEVFVQLYQRPPSRTENLSGWLYRVACNCGLNALRAHRRRQQYENRAGTGELHFRPGDDPAELVEQRQEQERVRQVLQAMRPRLAQVLFLRHSGFSYVEIANSLGLAVSSVGTLLARAEQEFARLYQAGEL